MSITLEYLKKTYSLKEFGDGLSFSEIRPRMECVDGFHMSVQGSETHYCAPRRNGWEFYEVEIGYPSEPVKELIPFAEEPDKPTDTVYGYVPVEIVDAVIAAHGGLKGQP